MISQAQLLAVLFSASLLATAEAQAGARFFDVSNSAELAQAINTSSSGDTIQLAQANYLSTIIIDGKGLTLVGSGPGTNLITNFTARNLPVDERLLISNLDFQPLGVGLFFELEDNDGPVWISQCTLEGSPGQAHRVARCASVVFEGCDIFGGLSTVAFNPGRPGLQLVDSSAWLYGTSVVGGGPADPSLPLDGREAVRSAGLSKLHLSDSSLAGGNGGTGNCEGSFGGDGVRVVSGTLDLFERDSSILGGLGVANVPPCLANFGDGVPVSGPALAGAFPAPSPLMAGPALVGEAAPIDLQFNSAPGELIYILSSVEATSAVAAPVGLHLFAPIPQIFMGVTDAMGSLSKTLTSMTMPPGLAVQTVLLQAGSIDPIAATFGLGNPKSLTVLDTLP